MEDVAVEEEVSEEVVSEEGQEEVSAEVQVEAEVHPLMMAGEWVEALMGEVEDSMGSVGGVHWVQEEHHHLVGAIMGEVHREWKVDEVHHLGEAQAQLVNILWQLVGLVGHQLWMAVVEEQWGDVDHHLEWGTR